MGVGRPWFAIKAEVRDPRAGSFVFDAQKTMYGGKHIAVGDTIFVFARENQGGTGLVARGVVTECDAVPRTSLARQTPRRSIAVTTNGFPTKPLGRAEVRAFRGGRDDGPEAELDFKLYRQATNKIIGLSEAGAGFLESLF